MKLRTMYSATKAALPAMVRSLALEWARYGATVNCVAPGIIDTPLTSGYLAENPDIARRVVEETPVGRLGLPDDIANVVGFLADPRSGFITGQTLTVDGGFSSGVGWW